MPILEEFVQPEVKQKVWEPHPKQVSFITVPWSVFEAFYGGAAGGGKTEILLMLPIIYGWFQNGNFKGLILRRTFPELEREIILRAYEYYPATGGSPTNNGKKWRWPSGAVIEFGHSEHESDIRKYDTAEYNYIAFDELTTFTEFQYLYLTSRARSSDPSLPAIIRSASNPGNVGHGWVRKRFVEPCVTGGKLLLDRKSQQKRIFIPALLTDNPHLMENDPGYRYRLEILPEAERRAKLLGDWWTFSGQAFGDFRIDPLPGEPAYAKHVVEPFEIPAWWPRILGIDWGFTAMTWAGWMAIAPTGRIYLYREYAHTQKLVSSWSTEIARLSSGEEIRRVYLDTNAWAQVGAELTVAQQFENLTRGYLPAPMKADKDRVGGKLLLQELIRWAPKPKKKIVHENFDPELANRILRVYGKDRYEQYLDWFKEEKEEIPGEDIPRLQIFSTCEEIIRTIPLCVYDSKKTEDVAEFNGDDPYDGLRYLIKGVDHYISDAKKEHDQLMRVNVAIQHLQESGDQTGFYRRMEKIERGKGHGKPIRAYHRRGRGRRVA